MEQGFRLQEITDAFSQVQIEQPGGWTGFPKRPDVIVRMMRNREHRAEQHKNRGGWDFADENCTICGGIGWEKKQTARGNLAVVRCICGQKKLEAARAGYKDS